MHLFMYLIKLGLLQSGTGQSEFIGNFLRGGGQGIKQKDKHNHLSKQFVCAAKCAAVLWLEHNSSVKCPTTNMSPWNSIAKQ